MPNALVEVWLPPRTTENLGKRGGRRQEEEAIGGKICLHHIFIYFLPWIFFFSSTWSFQLTISTTHKYAHDLLHNDMTKYENTKFGTQSASNSNRVWFASYVHVVPRNVLITLLITDGDLRPVCKTSMLVMLVYLLRIGSTERESATWCSSTAFTSPLGPRVYPTGVSKFMSKMRRIAVALRAGNDFLSTAPGTLPSTI